MIHGSLLAIDGILMSAGAMAVSVGSIDLKLCKLRILLEGIVSFTNQFIGLRPDVLIYFVKLVQSALTAKGGKEV